MGKSISMTDGVLSGRTALIACSAKLAPELTAGLQAMGAIVLPFPVLEAKKIEDTSALDMMIAGLDQYDWVIFTSAYGVSFFNRRLKELRVNAPAGSKIIAIGPATAAAIEKCGLTVELTAREFTAEGVLATLEHHYNGRENLSGLRILIPRALEAREFLPETLTAAGCRVDVAPCYRMIRPEANTELCLWLQSNNPDLIVFTSAAAVRNLLETVADALDKETARRLLRESTVAVIGPITGDELKAQGKSPEIVPEESAVPSLLAAIRHFFQRD